MLELHNTHALKPLENVKLGLCGISESKAKRRAQDMIATTGADLVKPLTFDSGVTHLLCGTGKRSESSTLHTLYQLRKGYVGNAEERKGAKQMHCLYYDFIEDCALVGGLIPEEDHGAYDIWGPSGKMPTSQQRELIRSMFPDRSPASLRHHFEERVARAQAEQARRTKEKAEAAAAARAKAQRTNRSGDGMHKALNKVAESVKAAEAKSAPQASSKQEAGLLSLQRNVAETSRNSTPNITEGEQSTASAPLRQKSRADEQIQSAAAKEKKPSGATDLKTRGALIGAMDDKGFSSMTFRLDMARKDATREVLIRAAIIGRGATVVEARDKSRSADWCIVSETVSASNAEEEWEGQGVRVTHFWLESCIFFERILDLDLDEKKQWPYMMPPGVDLPLANAKHVVVALTGFANDASVPDRTQVAKALEAAGCSVTDTFAKRVNTHLLTDRRMPSLDASAETLAREGLVKEAKAKEWGIPVVNRDWLATLWSTGVIGHPPNLESVQARQSSETGHDSVQTLDETQPVGPVGQGRAHTDTVENRRRATAVDVAGQESHSNDEAASIVPEKQQLQQPESLLAGTSMYISRIGNQVAALFAQRRSKHGDKSLESEDTSTTVSRSAANGSSDLPRRSRSGETGPNSGLRQSGKLPPKSRRSGTSGRKDGSPAMSRSGSAHGGRDSSKSVSPIKQNTMDDDGDGLPGDLKNVRNAEETMEAAERILAQQREDEARRVAAAARPHQRRGSEDGEDDRRRSQYSSQGEQRQHLHHQVLAPLATQSYCHRGGIDDESAMREDEDSIKITYRDPQSEKERRRLEELLASAKGGSDTSFQDNVSEAEVVQRPQPQQESATLSESQAGKKERVHQREGMDAEEATAGEEAQEPPVPKKQKRIQARKQPGGR